MSHRRDVHNTTKRKRKTSNMAQSIDLTEEESLLFLDIWESFPMLWDVKHKEYKNRKARVNALQEFSERFGHSWTTDQVHRKIDSLKSCYRKIKSRKRTTTGAPASQRKEWALFDRIHSFYGSCDYLGAGVVRSSCPGDSQSQIELEANEDADNVKKHVSGDIDICLQQMRHMTEEVRARHASGNSASITSSEPGTPATYVPPPGKTACVLEKRTGDAPPQDGGDFKAAAVGFLQQLQEHRNIQEKPHFHFVMTVAEDLSKMKSSRRLEMVKHKIRCVLHEALLAEMPPSDDEIV